MHRCMEAAQQPDNIWQAFEDGDDASGGNGLSRQQKRLLRQKKAKLFKRAAVQESSHSEAAEDYALEQAFEQHLRQLQQHYPDPQQQLAQQRLQPQAQQQQQQRQDKRGKGWSKRQPQKGGSQQQQQQQQRGPGGGGKRQRRSGTFIGASGSVDTIASSALAVPAALPAQQQAQISDFNKSGYRARGDVFPAAAAPPAAGAPASPLLVLPAEVPGTSSQQQQDWSATAAIMRSALAQLEEGEVAQEAAVKTGGICRVDLSAAALLISSQLAAPQPQAAAAGILRHPAAAADWDCGPVADATEGAVADGAAGQQQQPLEGQEGQQQGGSRRRVAVHGNYHRYYGYRYFGAECQEDPRLSVFERQWFARRRCLDVGCNEGLVTLGLVARHAPASMLGVDIDGALIAKACRHLREARTAAAERVRASRRGGISAEERKTAQISVASLSQTLFVHADILDSDVAEGGIDTITCLSMTKWVHLNRGDAGLQALFAAFARALAPGGLLLLEPQPWRSYRAAAGKVRREAAPAGSYFHRLDQLQLRPDAFADYLCSQLGFRLVKQFNVDSSAAGFDRPMLLLRKPRAGGATPIAEV